MTIGNRIGIALALACGMSLAACQTTGTRGSGKTGHELVQSAKSHKSTVMAQKHTAKKTTKPPKAVPKAIKSGNKKIEPPPIRNYTALEMWEVDGIDFDGTGSHENGVALYDSSTETLYVWWRDTMDLGGDGDRETFDGFFWINDGSVGLILDLRAGGEEAVVACVAKADGWSGLIVEESDGNTEVMALEATYMK